MDASFGKALGDAYATAILTLVLIIVLTVGSVFGGIGYAVGRWHEASRNEAWAVENGYAHYVMDPATGKSHIEWK